MKACARCRNRWLEGLKSSHPKSNTIRNTSGCKYSITLLDSMIAFSLSLRMPRSRGTACRNWPATVRTQ